MTHSTVIPSDSELVKIIMAHRYEVNMTNAPPEICASFLLTHYDRCTKSVLLYDKNNPILSKSSKASLKAISEYLTYTIERSNLHILLIDEFKLLALDKIL